MNESSVQNSDLLSNRGAVDNAIANKLGSSPVGGFVATSTAAGIPFLDFTRLHQPLVGEFKECLSNILEGNRFINSTEVVEFERAFAAFCNSKYVIGCDSGYGGLVLALKAMGLKEREQVIVPAMTFTATAEAVVNAGGCPVLVDVGRDGLIDLNQVEDQLKKGIKWMIPVHLFGQLVDPEGLRLLKAKYGVNIIEDAAQAHGAKKSGFEAGNIGDAASFSFYPGKNLGALGDAGAISCDDEGLRDRIVAYREHGQPKKNVFEYCGFTARLDNLQAGFLNIKLRHLEAWTKKRQLAALHYQGLLSEKFELQCANSGLNHVYHLFVVLVEDRAKYSKALQDKNIGFGLHYPVSLNQMPCYKQFDWYQASFPNAERYARCGLSLPIFPDIYSEEIDYICETIKGVEA